MSTTQTLWLVRGSVFLAAAILGGILVHRERDDPETRRMQWLLFVMPFATGGFFSASSVVLGGGAIWSFGKKYQESRRLNLQLSVSSVALGLVVLGYWATLFWAKNKGAAWIGAAKFSALGLYGLVLMQQAPEKREKALAVLPLAGAIMIVTSFPLQYISVLSDTIAPKGRLAGFFEYPNTFALFLLIGLILQYTKTQRKKADYIIDFLLILGVFLSGSRTNFAFMALVIVVGFLCRKDWKFRLVTAGGFVLCIAASLLGAKLLSGFSAARYLTTSASDTSFLSRVLYDVDALPVILRHPFGLGYMGYKAVQGSIQTGVYTVAYVHNELLQLLLDIGWIPTLALCAAIILAFFKRGAGAQRRLILLVIAGHCMLDFDLQFLSIWMVLLACLNLESGKTATLQRGVPAMLGGLVTLLVVCLWLVAGDTLYYLGATQQCLELTPFHGAALERQLSELDDAEVLDETAQKVLKLNRYSTIAWSARTNAAYATGNITAMMQYKEWAISTAPYSLDEYLDYFDKLYGAMERYIAIGDQDSAAVCAQKLLTIPDQLNAVMEGSSVLAWHVQHIPQLTLPAEYQEKLEQIPGNLKGGAANNETKIER